MKTNQQKANWILDLALFSGFLVSFALDLTGLSLHQWIGVLGGVLAAYHLVNHWDWVVAVTRRYFHKTSPQARGYYLLDGLILIGSFLILLTGLVISSWLDLPLTNYSAFKDIHVTTSIVTLIAIVLKIGLHWRWIVRVARQKLFIPLPPAPRPALVPGSMSRAEFLKLMGFVGVASLVAVAFTLNDNLETQAAALPTYSTTSKDAAGTEAVPPTTQAAAGSANQPGATPTTASTSQALPTPTTGTSTTACFVRCDKHCSYPGNCRKYQDANANGLCDQGECL